MFTDWSLVIEAKSSFWWPCGIVYYKPSIATESENWFCFIGTVSIKYNDDKKYLL